MIEINKGNFILKLFDDGKIIIHIIDSEHNSYFENLTPPIRHNFLLLFYIFQAYSKFGNNLTNIWYYLVHNYFFRNMGLNITIIFTLITYVKFLLGEKIWDATEKQIENSMIMHEIKVFMKEPFSKSSKNNSAIKEFKQKIKSAKRVDFDEHFILKGREHSSLFKLKDFIDSKKNFYSVEEDLVNGTKENCEESFERIEINLIPSNSMRLTNMLIKKG